MPVPVEIMAKKEVLQRLSFRKVWFSSVSIIPTVIIFIHNSDPLHNLSNLERREMSLEESVNLLSVLMYRVAHEMSYHFINPLKL